MTTTSVRARVLCAPLALLLVMPVGCRRAMSASDVATPPPSSAPGAGLGADASLQGAGPAEALLEAAEGLQLTVSQREKVLALKDRLSRYEENARAAFRALREDVADQVRAGAIQTASVQVDEDRAAGALTIHVDEGAETMNALYATLDASQRAAVVAAVRASRPPPATASPFDEPQGRLDATLDGFQRSGFDGWTVVPPPLAPPAAAFRQAVDREIVELARRVPTMRVDQRERLAATIEEGADKLRRPWSASRTP